MPTTYTFTVRAVDSTAPTPQTVDKTFTLTVDFKALLAAATGLTGGTLRLLNAPSYAGSAVTPAGIDAEEWTTANRVAVTADGSLIAVVLNSAGRLVVFNSSQAVVHTQYLLGLADRPVSSTFLAFNTAGTRLTVGYLDPTDSYIVEELNTSTWATTQIDQTGGTLEQYTDGAYDPSGSYFAAAYFEIDTAFLYVYNSASILGVPVATKTFTPTQGSLDSISWSPDGSLIAIAVNGGLRVYETTGWTEVSTGLSLGFVRSVAFSPDANYLLCLTSTEAVSLDVSGWGTSNPSVFPPAAARKAVWMPDATGYIITSTVSPFISFWDLATGARRNQQVTLPAATNDIAISNAL